MCTMARVTHRLGVLAGERGRRIAPLESAGVEIADRARGKGAVQFPRNCSRVDETYNVRFDAGGGIEAREAGCLGEMVWTPPTSRLK